MDPGHSGVIFMRIAANRCEANQVKEGHTRSHPGIEQSSIVFVLVPEWGYTQSGTIKMAEFEDLSLENPAV